MWSTEHKDQGDTKIAQLFLSIRETADLRQRHVVRQVTAPYSAWQRFPLCPTESNVNENCKVIQNPKFLPDHPPKRIICSFCHSRHSLKISERSLHNFLSYLANTQADRQTDRQTNKLWQKHNLLGGGNNIALMQTFTGPDVIGEMISTKTSAMHYYTDRDNSR